MRPALTLDDIDEQIWGRARVGAQEHRRLGETLLSWAAQPHPDDEVNAGFLMVQAGEQFTLGDDDTRALAAFRSAARTGDRVEPDVRCYLFAALLQAGRQEEAAGLALELRRERPTNPHVFLFMGEAFESAGQLDEAVRWFTQGVTQLERTHPGSPDMAMLVQGRWRVRHSIGFPPDHYDELALALQESADDDES